MRHKVRCVWVRSRGLWLALVIPCHYKFSTSEDGPSMAGSLGRHLGSDKQAGRRANKRIPPSPMYFSLSLLSVRCGGCRAPGT